MPEPAADKKQKRLKILEADEIGAVYGCFCIKPRKGIFQRELLW
jgi:hypothetical protein